ncbi:lipoate--protein ligase family protein [Candidatus Woesearchaeota archaeon]|nr:lipoate--protein ligase family protein [Candidatus Woesearchaeota archaeon]
MNVKEIKMRLIDTSYNNAAMNMAIDEALLQSKEPVLRLYQWKPSALSLGYFQDIKDINVKECEKRKIEIVRRLTGGKTIFHDKELTYSFVTDEKEMPKSIIESYKIISKGILYALKSLGISASMKKSIKKNKNKSPVCFNEPSYYEVVVNGKKIVGSAQKRFNGKLLQHGSILVDVDYDKLISLFNLKDKEKSVEISKKRITSIKEFNKRISIKKLKKYLKEGFEKNLGIKLVNDKLTKDELKLAKKLAKDKYSTKNWNRKE